MAKRNLDKDKIGSEDNKAPERRRRTTSTDATGKAAAPRARGRRKTDVTAAPAEAHDASSAALTAPTAAATGQTVSAIQAETSTDAGNGQHVDIVQIPHDHIALRAYHLYLERGGQAGDQFLDWVTAERQLREQFARR